MPGKPGVLVGQLFHLFYMLPVLVFPCLHLGKGLPLLGPPSLDNGIEHDLAIPPAYHRVVSLYSFLKLSFAGSILVRVLKMILASFLLSCCM